MIRNTGDRDGADVVQVYADLPDADAPGRLIGFTRVDVLAGGSSAFEVRIPVERLATRYPVEHAWRSAAGLHRISVARHAADLGRRDTEVALGSP